MRVKFFISLILLIILGFGYWLIQRPTPYTLFLQETYTVIQTNYWEKISDTDLIKLYAEAAQLPGTFKNKRQLFQSLKKAIKTEADAAVVADTVLSNLKPVGRSRLYTQQLTRALANNVNNVDPTTNHYQELNLNQNASAAAITQAFQEKSAKASTSAQKQKLEQAYTSLKDQTTRKIYDLTGADPTMPHKKISNSIYYLGIKKFSPTTLQELTGVSQKTDAFPGLNTLILDLRDNVGGAIDGLGYFLGPFIGPNQLAYQFIHQGKTEDFKTLTGWLPGLVKFKKIIVLINANTQSSAETMAAALKKYKVGLIVGTTTHGWGTIESVYPLKHQLSENQAYSIFLVHHLALREDGQPIEGRGVEPDVYIQTIDSNMKQIIPYL